MLPTYRKYSDLVPEYLHGRPRKIIIHCLDRRSNSKKFSDEDILQADLTNGVFDLQSSSKVHTIDFGFANGKPSCTCADWVKWNIPCKHFFAIFRLVEGWGWESLPDVYKRSPYLCDDSSALHEYSASHASEIDNANHSIEAADDAATVLATEETDEVVLSTHETDEIVLATDELPAKKVFFL